MSREFSGDASEVLVLMLEAFRVVPFALRSVLRVPFTFPTFSAAMASN